jgi:hypothetical protein
MSTINGLPAHVLLVHVVVVLVPLTAVLAILCAVLPSVRRRLVWLVAALAAITVAAVPLTTNAGEWLLRRVGETPQLRTHAHLGDTMIYFAIALLVVALLLLAVHLLEAGDRPVSRVVLGIVAVLTIAAGVAATVQVYRIGDSGAHAVWGGTQAISVPSARVPG